jgi:hypothetical protein
MVVITASYNYSHMERMKIISVRLTVKQIRLGLTLHTGEKESLPPLNGAQITKLKHLTLVSLAMERRVNHTDTVTLSLTENISSLRSYLIKRFSPPCKCRLYEI